MENPIKMDDLGVPLFSETSIWHLDGCQVFPDYFVELCFQADQNDVGQLGNGGIGTHLRLTITCPDFFQKGTHRDLDS